MEITLGCDPEFEELTGTKEYRPIPTTIGGEENGPIGRDGAGFQVELRPSASTTPIGVIKNLRKLIEEVNLPLSTRGDKYPLGGHIHIGIPNDVDDETIEDIVKVLDRFIGKKVLPLSGEARGDYEVLGAYELKPWGFEYRTPPAAVFYHPAMGEITLKLVKNLVEKFLLGQIKEKEYVGYEDYILQGGLTPGEIRCWCNLMCQYKLNPPVYINKLWGAEPSLLVFRDEWDERVKELVKTLLGDIQGRLILYGLAASRGRVVAGIELPGYETIDHPIEDCGVAVVGVPYNLRVPQNEERPEREIKALCQAIRRTICV